MSNRNNQPLQFGKVSTSTMSQVARHHDLSYLHSGMQTFELNKPGKPERSVTRHHMAKQNEHSMAAGKLKRSAPKEAAERTTAPKQDPLQARARAGRN